MRLVLIAIMSLYLLTATQLYLTVSHALSCIISDANLQGHAHGTGKEGDGGLGSGFAVGSSESSALQVQNLLASHCCGVSRAGHSTTESEYRNPN